MTAALVAGVLLVALYGVVAVVFMIFSCAELVDTGRSSPVTLLLAVVTSLAWPLTLMVMTVVVVMRSSRHAEPERPRTAPTPLAARRRFPV
ncbi:hypothetical protein [Polymorphum gilvum]|uniref:Transmembrane protein n=1 Tax=Polymorphum gilvum (strain LMG 25793 / CGMCC 1.9160 / SL003B-26A1) TaxID=991905 RepID=F2IW87_POLGS|nr:hypothetical protein [Polymorphum gilvum]ADZ71472.1 hypothetical protein SL003B_3049 [Polymorphum gilvum SL003B-26A1]